MTGLQGTMAEWTTHHRRDARGRGSVLESTLCGEVAHNAFGRKAIGGVSRAIRVLVVGPGMHLIPELHAFRVTRVVLLRHDRRCGGSAERKPMLVDEGGCRIGRLGFGWLHGGGGERRTGSDNADQTYRDQQPDACSATRPRCGDVLLRVRSRGRWSGQQGVGSGAVSRLVLVRPTVRIHEPQLPVAAVVPPRRLFTHVNLLSSEPAAFKR